MLTQNQFAYSIKIYNSTYNLKYRKDNITTQKYKKYEEGFKILNVTDSVSNNKLKINATISSSVSGTFETMLFLSYNKSIIYVKENESIINSVQDLIFGFDSETIKRTHYIGNFNVSSLKIGKKLINTNFMTSFYDFSRFADTPYISGITDEGLLANNGTFSSLKIGVNVQTMKDGNYTLTLALYDLLGEIIDMKNSTFSLNAGKNLALFFINSSDIYNKKVSGPLIIKSIELFDKNILIDRINDAHITKSYNFNDFLKPNLPDLIVNISVSDQYHYGSGNITINFSFKNKGDKQAFNVFTELFDNRTFLKINQSNLLDVNSQVTYGFKFTSISDFEVGAVADFPDFIEESDELNNAQHIIIKLNKPPKLELINDLTVNETDKILINLSAFDTNEDDLFFYINSSKFSNNNSIFYWATTTADSGNYTLRASVSDGYLNDSAAFKITVLDVPEKDIDNDGIDDNADALIGNEHSANTSTINLSMLIDDSNNLSQTFNESRKVKFVDDNLIIVEFNFNFSLYKLNLINLTINKQAGNASGALLIKGLRLPDGITKTAYIDRINAAINGVCIRDEEISTINEISADCNSINEFKIECDGTLQNSYMCAYNTTLNKYKVEGLKHSGVIQFAYTKPATESSSSSSSSSSSTISSGGGGGGSLITCNSNWQCGDWSECLNGFKNRKCIDKNQCAALIDKPIELQKCVNNTEEPARKEKFGGGIAALNYTQWAIDKIKKSIKNTDKANSGITGLVIKKSGNDGNLGMLAALAIVLIVLGTYLTIRKIFYKKINKKTK